MLAVGRKPVGPVKPYADRVQEFVDFLGKQAPYDALDAEDLEVYEHLEFAPLINAKDEDDGYLVSFIIDENAGASECILIDCKRFEDGPVCRIALPHKISSGTHSVWADRKFIKEGVNGA